MLVVRVVCSAAPQGFSVRAAAVATGAVLIPTRPGLSVGASCGGVDGSEAGGGEGEEHLRTISHRGRHTVVAARGAGMHELPGITGVQVRTGRADLGAAVVAPRPHHPIPTVLVAADQLNGVGAEPDRFRAPPSGVESHRGRAAHHLLHDLGGVDGVRHPGQGKPRRCRVVKTLVESCRPDV